MAVLITGGAGYLGSHVSRLLVERGEEVVVVDNLSTGFAPAASGELILCDIRDTQALRGIMRGHGVTAVLHFAARTQVGESMSNPALYYDNNVGGSFSLLRAMAEENIKAIVFSSSAAVYGQTDRMPIAEDAPTNPASVYGKTKLMIEQALRDFDAAYGMRSISLRYFNIAGAHDSGEIGEAHDPETHLIPNILKHLMNPDTPFYLTGTDFPTRDGTCVRDYIEVQDLSEAHLLALEALRDGHLTESYNLGSGQGFSNREVIACAEKIAGKKAHIIEMDRRPGDPPVLIASNEKFRRETGWNPHRTNLDAIVAGAWKWHTGHPCGYQE